MDRTDDNKDFIVECQVCHAQYKNHVGSTPCCGSIAFDVKAGTIHVYTKPAANKATEKG